MSVQSGNESANSDFDGIFSPEDLELDSRIKSFRKAELELEEILLDPSLDQARKEVESMMLTYDEMKKKDSFRASGTFIRESLQAGKEKQVSDETEEIRDEVSKAGVSGLSAEWVREWHRKKQMEGFSPAEQERKSFIVSSLESATLTSEEATEKAAPVVALVETSKRSGTRRIISITSLAAAAVLGAFIGLRSLLPSGDTSKLYDNYYTTFQAVTPITRGVNNTVSTTYISAINSFKKGNFDEAEAGFSKSSGENPADLSSEFYLGLSQLEAGKIDEAISSLSTASAGTGKFTKESQWYLGLAYLKKGDAEKAAGCFKALASSDGYYREASEKILRRLKK